MSKKRRDRLHIKCKDMWYLQKELTGNNEHMLSMFELANVVAALKGWPEITDGQAKYREFSKHYLIKYMAERDRQPTLEKPVCWVYFIQSNSKGPIKIGVADNIESRMLSLQTGSPYKLSLIAKIGCTGRKHAYDTEKNLHKKFSEHRLEGEWFNRSVLTYLLDSKDNVEWVDQEKLEKIRFRNKSNNEVNRESQQITAKEHKEIIKNRLLKGDLERIKQPVNHQKKYLNDQQLKKWAK